MAIDDFESVFTVWNKLLEELNNVVEIDDSTRDELVVELKVIYEKFLKEVKNLQNKEKNGQGANGEKGEGQDDADPDGFSLEPKIFSGRRGLSRKMKSRRFVKEKRSRGRPRKNEIVKKYLKRT